ncbi:hypothetical protein A2615_00460 [Candidatus Curtissbacteria bacterium RIFOXYD1_FULL_41_36]|nr:MAG: hypothetical protein A2615_00460 [Candidatus Curtissbacteria bacterium RIFOXYD1_FULL_41_36]OGE15576.1 MAG: hypothetical protein A2409_01455 [Candidatus Curtissbacteria bacterium RIFOXYC1_FULL_41_36]
MTKNSLRLVVFAAFAIFFLIINLKSAFAIDFNDWQIGGLSGDYDCAGYWSSTSLETWISPGDGWSYERGGNVRVAGRFHFNTYANVGCIQNHSFRYRFDLKFDGSNLITDWIVPGADIITVPVGGGLWSHEFTLDNTVQVPGGASIGSHNIGYVLRHYYNGGVWVQVRAATAYASINVTSTPNPTPSSGPNPTPSSPPGGINITLAEGRCDIYGHPYIRLEWTGPISGSNYYIGRDQGAGYYQTSTTHSSPFDTNGYYDELYGVGNMAGFNETSDYIVKISDGSVPEARRSGTTPGSCGAPPSPTPTPATLDVDLRGRPPGGSWSSSVTVAPNEPVDLEGQIDEYDTNYSRDFRYRFDCDTNTSPTWNADSGWGIYATVYTVEDLCSYPSVGTYTARLRGDQNDAGLYDTDNMTVRVANPTNLNVTAFFDKNDDGIQDPGEQFNAGGNPAFSTAANNFRINGTNFAIDADGHGSGTVYSGSAVAGRLYLNSGGWVGSKWTYEFVGVGSGGPNTYTSGPTATTPAVPSGFDSDDTVNLNLGIRLPAPAAPQNLWAQPGCVSYQPKIDFRWDDVANETNYVLDVSTDPGFGSWGSITLPADPSGSVTFTWDNGVVLDDYGGPTVIGNGAYYWRVFARNAGGDGPYRYPRNQLSPPGDIGLNPTDEYKVPVITNCVPPDPEFDNDPAIGIQLFSDPGRSNLSQSFEPGDTIYVRAVLRNPGVAFSDTFDLAFYIDRSSDPVCDDLPDPTDPPWDTKRTLSGMSAGQIYTWEFDVPAPTSAGDKTAYIFADYECDIDESSLPNGEENNLDWVSYTIDVDAWFETTGGDVGSAGAITAEILPPVALPQKYNSKYLLASGANQWQVTSENNWYITNYTPHRLIPTGTVYDYLASRFKQKAMDNPDSGEECNVASLHSGLNYCDASVTGSITIDGGNWTGGNAVLFIENGDLIVTNDLTVDPTGINTLTFVVSRDIYINTNVNQADGVYIAGGTFFDVTDPLDPSTFVVDRALTINGAVYATTVDLDRVLSNDPLCGSTCDNNQSPAEIINFQPKYLVALAGDDYLGSPAISWREVAP